MFIAQASPTQLYRAETSGDGSFAFTSEGDSTTDVVYNAISFNPADGYIYGITTGGSRYPVGSLVRVGEGAAVERVGETTYAHPNGSTRFYVGAFNPTDGLFYVSDTTSNTTVLAIDVSSGAVVRTVDLGQPAGVQDFEFADGYAWGVASSGAVHRIDVVDGAVDVFPGILPAATGGYGAAWQFGNGSLGFSANATGDVSQLRIVDGATATPSFELVSTVPGPSSSLNDGTAIPGLPADLAIEKTAPAAFTAGDRIVYDITVTNLGPGVSSGWSVSDALPAGLDEATVIGDVTADVADDRITVSGGRLEVGASATFQIEADTNVAPGECLDNTAIVLRNERDAEEANNEDTASSCALSLAVEKTSDATEDTRPGDVVTYTVTATNDGTADFTDEQPAVVRDDLSGVLDDADYAGDAVATRPGAVSYAEPLLSWSGPLPAGESVDLTYSVTVGSSGDGRLRNVAWQPGDPADTQPPACNPVGEDGRDPASGEPCAAVEVPLPRLTVEKTADRETLPVDGAAVTYTVRVTNTGEGDFTEPAPATMVDDLSDVLNSATFDGDATASVGSVTYDEPILTWSGPLAAGESADISYTVRYSAAGDNRLVNEACVPAELVSPGASPCSTVSIPGADLSSWKSVSSSDAPTVAGSVLTYTLFFENSGEAAAAVDFVDDLTHVVDDADVTLEPLSDGLSAVRDGNRISVTGEVPAGETFSVTYEATVRADGERGDDIAANFLLANDPENPPVPPAEPVCETSDAARPDCTSTPIAAIEYSKSVVSSTEEVRTGTVLTYTITIDSTGTATAPVSRDDVLSGVLDDAELTSPPFSDTDSVTVSDVVDGRFEIGGELAAGETAVITYEVTVKAAADRGDNRAANFLVPAGETPAETCAEGSADCTSTPIPQIDAVKSSDPESGSTVVAGQLVTYTLTFTNSGQAAGTVDHTDHLAGVLDDATVTEPASTSDDALTVATADESIEVDGVLAAGQTATVSYAVAVKEDGSRGDDLLGNLLADSGNTYPACGDDGVSCTENPIPSIQAWKSVSADSLPVGEGTVLTYTLFFENSGQAAGDVAFVDDLVHVTDDADVTAEPTADDGLAVARDGDAISISGSVAPGGTSAVTYQVTVREDGERGDDIAANFLLHPGEEPPAGPVCQPTDAEHPECTLTPIGQLLTSKSVSASTDPVVAGTELTYTLTFDNQGEGPVAVDHQDVLVDVLDDAALTTAPAASDGALSVSDVEDGRFTVAGEIDAGETVTVTYVVTVNAEDERGNDVASNFLVPAGEEPPAECVAGADLNCTVTPLPNLTTAKSSDPGSGATVSAGQDISYTLTFANSGGAAAEVDYTDSLEGVLDDADLVGEPVASSDMLAATAGSDQIAITGTVPAGETITVTYAVRVRGDGDRGDDVLANHLFPSGEEPPATCEDGDADCTVHVVPEIVETKSVDPGSGTPVVAGQELTYTLTFRNDGAAAGDVDRIDDLGHLLDDADIVTEPTASDDAIAVSRDDAVISIAGSLEPGQEATVTYTVVVREAADRGDSRIANFLLASDQEPPAEPSCTPGEGATPDCTINPVGDIVPSKTVDPESGTAVSEGQELTYTLSFENVGEAPAEVSYVDALAGVLDDAELSGEVTASDGLAVAGPEDEQLTITGTVQPGETATVTYTVEVLPYAGQGDHILANYLVPAGIVPPAECLGDNPLCTQNTIDPPEPGTPTPSDPPAQPSPSPTPQEPGLNPTGGALTGVLAAAAVLALLVGGGAILVARRRTGGDAMS